MKQFFVLEAVFLLFLFFCSVSTSSDLDSDKKALIEFAGALKDGKNLNWNVNTSVCSSWVGISCNYNRVIALQLPSYELNGEIQYNTLGKLYSLVILNLHNNNLSGHIPLDLLSLPSLNSIFLHNNELSGHIPYSLSPRIQILDLSTNNLSGRIPSTLDLLKHLVGLYLQNNSLTGSIPNLRLTMLGELNLSWNNLNGSIPLNFHRFPASSFQGNALCGSPLKVCSSPSLTAPKKIILSTKDYWGIAIGLTSGIVFSLYALYMKWGRKGKKDRIRGWFYPYYHAEHLLHNDAIVLGKGRHGIAFKVTLEDGTYMVVKRLKKVIAGEKEFEQHMIFGLIVSVVTQMLFLFEDLYTIGT